jgi:hypothetical protein
VWQLSMLIDFEWWEGRRIAVVAQAAHVCPWYGYCMSIQGCYLRVFDACLLT